jgi:2-iminobutanoate/2-iminopropanoate deaminase
MIREVLIVVARTKFFFTLPQIRFISDNQYFHIQTKKISDIWSKVKKIMAKEVVYSANAPEPIGPYSQAIKAGNMLFISGQIAIDRSTGNLVTGNIMDESQLVMKNLSEVLKAAGMDFSNIVKSTIFLKDMNNFPKVNEVYGSFFKEMPPARETVEVSRLPKDVNVEISCIAVK